MAMVDMSASVSLVAIVFPSLGAVLLLLGLLGRRVGDAPHCQRCGYNLTGLTSNRCPECGGGIELDAVTHGAHHRRRGFLASGVVLLLFAAMAWRTLIQRIVARDGWYEACPLAWVLTGAEKGSRSALTELERRVRSGKLSLAEFRKIADAALEVQGRVSVPDDLTTWVTMLDRFDSGGLLAEPQQARYHQQVILPSAMEVRPKVRSGDTLPWRVSVIGRGPAIETLRVSLADGRFRIGGRDYDPGLSGSISIPEAGLTESFTGTLNVDDLSPGQYSVQFTATERVKRGSSLVSSTGLALTAEVEILPADASDPLNVRRDADTARRLREAIILRFVSPKSYWRSVPLSLDVLSSTANLFPNPPVGQTQERREYWVGFKRAAPVPVDAVFDAIIRQGNTEYQTAADFGNTLIVSRTADRPAWCVSVDVLGLGNGPVFVILRSNPEAIRQSVDVFDTWAGELVFGPIEQPSIHGGNLDLHASTNGLDTLPAPEQPRQP